MLFEPLLDAAPAVRSGRPGRPRRRPDKLHADKGYDNNRCRAYLRRRGITARIARRGVESKQKLGRHRWVVERTVSDPAVQAARTALRPHRADHERPAHSRLRLHLLQDPRTPRRVMKPGLSTTCR
jgi:IS5 family transposase